MFLRDLFASVRRRWYFMVAGLLLTAAGATFAYQGTPVHYEATGSVALIPPPTAVISGDNPFLYMGGLEQALGVLTVKLNSPEVRRPIADEYPTAEYTTARDPSTNGPIILITVQGTSSADTLGALQRVLDAVAENLAKLQDNLGLSPGSKMTSMQLSMDVEPDANNTASTRIVLALSAAGAAASLLITGQLDKVMTRPKGHRASGQAAPSTTDDTGKSTAQPAAIPSTPDNSKAGASTKIGAPDDGTREPLYAHRR